MFNPCTKIRIMCGADGVSDEDCTRETIDLSLFGRVPYVDEIIVTDLGCYLVSEVAHCLKEGTINLWVDPKKSDFYD